MLLRGYIRVVGVDPGGQTGVAAVTWDPVSRRGYLLGRTETLRFEFPLPDVVNVINELVPDVVAIERFVVGKRAARSKSGSAGERARLIIGAVTAEFPTLYANTASVAKAWATDRRLEAAGLDRFTSVHERDAARHALYVIVKCGWGPDPLSKAYAPYRED